MKAHIRKDSNKVFPFYSSVVGRDGEPQCTSIRILFATRYLGLVAAPSNEPSVGADRLELAVQRVLLNLERLGAVDQLLHHLALRKRERKQGEFQGGSNAARVPCSHTYG